jgi:hypothetical protein
MIIEASRLRFLLCHAPGVQIAAARADARKALLSLNFLNPCLNCPKLK